MYFKFIKINIFLRIIRMKILNFNQIWNEIYCSQKRIKVIDTIENDEIVTITVNVFYRKWSKDEN